MNELTTLMDPDTLETLKAQLLELIERDEVVREVLRRVLTDE